MTITMTPTEVHPDQGQATEQPGDEYEWRSRGACRTEDPDLFFPLGDGKTSTLQEEHAKAVCAQCPVSTKCFRWSLDKKIEYGVWGGHSEKERRAILRKLGTITPGRNPKQ